MVERYLQVAVALLERAAVALLLLLDVRHAGRSSVGRSAAYGSGRCGGAQERRDLGSRRTHPEPRLRRAARADRPPSSPPGPASAASPASPARSWPRRSSAPRGRSPPSSSPSRCPTCCAAWWPTRRCRRPSCPSSPSWRSRAARARPSGWPGALFGLISMGLGLITLLAIVAAPWLMPLFAPGLPPDLIDQTVHAGPDHVPDRGAAGPDRPGGRRSCRPAASSAPRPSCRCSGTS